MPSDENDLLYGVPAIARFMSLSERQVYHLASRGRFPTFKIGRKVCATKAKLKAWLDQVQDHPAPSQQGATDASE